MPKEEFELEFEVAKPDDEIYQDKNIYAVTMTAPPPKIIESDTVAKVEEKEPTK